MPPLTLSDLVFSPQANHNFSKTLSSIKCSTLSITNRLRSIEEDASFAQQVAADYGRPLIANERCGSWYIDPATKAGSAYFKSTDGHTGVWKFSSRRLNLHLLEIIGEHDGRGKRIPDALSKTIPIWCCVINHFLFPSSILEHHALYTPPQIISQTEHSQISALIPTFLSSLLDLGISPEGYRSKIKKPLRPFWITPDTYTQTTIGRNTLPGNNNGSSVPIEIFRDFHPVICCTVSRRVEAGEISAGGYIQGAGDDTENWAQGLTAPIFWANKDLLMHTEEADLAKLIKELVSKAQDEAGTIIDSEKGDFDYCKLKCINPTTSLFITTTSALPTHNVVTSTTSMNKTTFTILLGTASLTPESTWQKSTTCLELSLGAHKTGSRNLRLALPFIISRLSSHIQKCSSNGTNSNSREPRIIIACPTGKDLSIGTALAILCLFYDERGRIYDIDGENDTKKNIVNKTFIRQRMGWISTSLPDANPSRQTLQSVNSFLMERPDYC
ncbi:tRNA a64-2'-o-ribosylphosphate transferase-like protein [Xylogone sp. PMI_703]|nr:tRNA a64-2'-o-ribosylphosphate transferase-like protein [Xylogone sp. PMI_703]